MLLLWTAVLDVDCMIWILVLRPLISWLMRVRRRWMLRGLSLIKWRRHSRLSWSVWMNRASYILEVQF